MTANSPDPVLPASGNANANQYKPWRCGDPLDYVLTMPRNGEGKPLHHMHRRIKDFDQDICAAWRDEIEHMLIFAGLFSATLTAFIVESYKWLQVDNRAVAAQLLAQMSLQLSAMANNSTPVPPATLQSSFTPEPYIVRVNIYWFISLIICLSTVVFGILCLQWIREYSRNMAFSSADAVTIRQMRYDGLLRWGVPTVIAWLPIMLQASVLLFFAGGLDLLWSEHSTVASVMTSVIGLVVSGILFTSYAPVIQTLRLLHHFTKGCDPNTYVAPCPYRSPVPWVMLRFIMWIDPVLVRQRHKWTSWDDIDDFFHENSKQNIYGQKVVNAKGLARSLQWLMDKLSPDLNHEIPRDLYHSLHSSIDRTASGLVLSEWAKIADEGKEAEALVSHDALSLSMHYDLLLERLLRQCLPTKDNRGLLLELQVRCLNTFEDKEEMVEVYSEAANNCYYYCQEAQGRFHLEENAVLFQALMTTLKFHNRLCREPFTENHLGSVLACLIQNTPVEEDNANLCYQILHQFRLLLDEIYESHGDSFGASRNMDPHSISLLLHKLDLRSTLQWEAAIQKFTGNEVGVVDALTSLMENLMVTLEKCGQKGDAGQIKSQLDAFRDNQPLYFF